MIRAANTMLAGCLALALAPSVLPAQAADSLVGVWASETVFPASLGGELTVTRDGPGWRARIADAEAASTAAGDSVRFTFGGRGGFRGALAGDAIEGWWLQPSARFPVAAGQPFATPLVLRRGADGTWRGTVRPLDRRFTLYARIFRDSTGALAGAFRNPERNSRGGVSRFRVAQVGDSVLFTARLDTTLPEFRHAGVLLRGPDRLRLFWRDLRDTVELVRRAPSEAAAFFPRPPGEPPYAYRRPEETGDGWRTARAAEVGIDEAALAGLVQRMIDADPAARRPSLIHSLLVARRGRLVLEEYFFGHGRDTPHDVRSVGKTFGSVMLGAAMREGAPLLPQSPIYQVLEGMGPFANPDPRKAGITLAHLMTHTSGLACNDNDEASPGNEGTMQDQEEQPDWWKYTLDLPMAHDPGTRYAYCSANANLVGGALTAATGTWLPALFDRTVARPLQFGPYYWNLMPTGEGYLGGGAFLRPRDLLKVGQAFLDGGTWNGRRIVDSAWVALSTAVHAEITPATTGLSPEDFGNFYGEGLDGYAWHLGTLTSGGRPYREYEASGNGGQLLIVVPEAELVVVLTAGNYAQGGIWGRWRQEIVADVIISAIEP